MYGDTDVQSETVNGEPLSHWYDLYRPLETESRRVEQHARSLKAHIATKRKEEDATQQKGSTTRFVTTEMDELRASLMGQALAATLVPLFNLVKTLESVKPLPNDFPQNPKHTKWDHCDAIEQAMGVYGLSHDDARRVRALRDIHDMGSKLCISWKAIKYEEDKKPVRKNYNISYADAFAATPNMQNGEKLLTTLEWNPKTVLPFRTVRK